MEIEINKECTYSSIHSCPCCGKQALDSEANKLFYTHTCWYCRSEYMIKSIDENRIIDNVSYAYELKVIKNRYDYIVEPIDNPKTSFIKIMKAHYIASELFSDEEDKDIFFAFLNNELLLRFTNDIYTLYKQALIDTLNLKFLVCDIEDGKFIECSVWSDDKEYKVRFVKANDSIFMGIFEADNPKETMIVLSMFDANSVFSRENFNKKYNWRYQ